MDSAFSDGFQVGEIHHTNIRPYDYTVWPLCVSWEVCSVRLSSTRNPHLVGKLFWSEITHKVSVVLHHTLEFATLSVCSYFWAITHLVKSSNVTLSENYPGMLNVNWQLQFIFEVSLTPKSTVLFKLCMAMEFFFSFLKRFDLFITWAVAANGGLLEEVVVVWSGGSDTGVSFITVGNSLWALMEIIMHVHNCPKAKGLDSVCMPSSMKVFAIILFKCKVPWIWQLLYLCKICMFIFYFKVAYSLW